MEEKRKILTDILGYYSKRGNEHLYACPYCEHHKRKMSVNFALNAFKCWVCDVRGKNIYRMVRKYGSYAQRQKWLELDGRLDLSEFDKIFNEIHEIEEEQIVELPKEFISLCNRGLSKAAHRALDYLFARGLSKQDVLMWKIGYCKEGRYNGRIIIPSFNNRGNCSYFISRSYVGHQRKYLNPQADKNIIFNELLVDWDQPVVLVEGVFDAIIAGDNAVPILGSTLRTESKLFQALSINDNQVYIALDEDAEKKAGRMIKNMLEYDLEVFKIDTSGCEDIGSMSKEEFQKRKASAKPIDGDTYFFEDLFRGINV